MKFWAGWAVECQMQNGDVNYLSVDPNHAEPGCWPSQSIAEAFADFVLNAPTVLSVTVVEWTAEDHCKANIYNEPESTYHTRQPREEIHPYTSHPIPCSCVDCGSYYID